MTSKKYREIITIASKIIDYLSVDSNKQENVEEKKKIFSQVLMCKIVGELVVESTRLKSAKELTKEKEQSNLKQMSHTLSRLLEATTNEEAVALAKVAIKKIKNKA